jgi:hypothetical protein
MLYPLLFIFTIPPQHFIVKYYIIELEAVLRSVMNLFLFVFLEFYTYFPLAFSVFFLFPRGIFFNYLLFTAFRTED